MEVRDATETDLPALLEIHNHAIANLTAIWTEHPDDLAGRRQWMDEHRARNFPILVAIEAGEIFGYAAYGDFRAKDGYRHTVEHSVYVRNDLYRRGVGRTLMVKLIERARAQSLHVMIGGIEASNHASLALHQALGFREVARFREVGCKFGRWLDLVFVQLLLDSRKMP